MTTKTKVLLGVAALTAAVFLLPVAFPSIWSHGGTGYFYRGRCACGHPMYVRILGDGYFDYSPGHGRAEDRAYSLRENTNGWDMIREFDPRSDEVYIHFAPTGLVARAWVEKGELCEVWVGTSREVRYPRVFNPWPIWLAKLLNE